MALLQSTEHGLVELFTLPVETLGPLSRHQCSVTLQKRLVVTYLDGATTDAPGALAEGRASPTDLSLSPVPTHSIAVLVLEAALKAQYLPLWTEVGVSLGLVGEVKAFFGL